MSSAPSFDHLLPDLIIAEAEQAFGCRFSGVVLPRPSYINRVYELENEFGDRVILKFYRPGRWERGALLEEQLFTFDCRSAEIPVVAPLRFPGGGSLRETANGIYFAAFPKRWGRPFEILEDEDYRRLGRLLGRLHGVGEQRRSSFRPRLDPRRSTAGQIDNLLGGGFAGPAVIRALEEALTSLYRTILAAYGEESEIIRLHGDCHGNNILQRPDEGLMLIDFDDMMAGPPVQDLWLLLPGYAAECRREWDLIAGGYREFRELPEREFRRIEPLRAMRMIHYLDWCARQRGDCNFRERYPDWGSDGFWRSEIAVLRGQHRVIAASTGVV